MLSVAPLPASAPVPRPFAGPNLNIHLICPDCRETPPNIVEEFSSGDMVCGTCGKLGLKCERERIY